MRVTVLIENTAPAGLACEHGLSLHIEHGGRRWLLDAGASPRLVENAAALEVDLGAVDAAVLSHGHFDHAGGFSAFFARNAAAPLYLRPQALEPGYVRTRSEPRYIGVPGERAGYAQRLRFVDGPLEAAPGVWLLPHDTPGRARRGRAVSMYRETAAGAVDDDFSHEQSLIFVTDDGLVLFSSCSHAGADTVVEEARRFFPGRPVRAFLGGFHLMGHGGVTTLGAPPAAVEALGRRLLELGVEEVMVIGHTDCGVAHINADMMIRHLIQRGISQDHIDMMRYCGIDFEAWLRGFDCVENSVAETVDLLRNHPLMPADVTIRGYVINTETGELTPQE